MIQQRNTALHAAETTVFPDLVDLNRLSDQAFGDALALLFEPAPQFAARLAAERPFASDAALLGAATRVAREMPEDEQVELVNAHPRLGAGGALSAQSRREQGAADASVDTELLRLNQAYEARFGFRYLVFVAGRHRRALIPEFQAGLARERSAELRRALGDTCAIAAARLDRFRRTPREIP